LIKAKDPKNKLRNYLENRQNIVFNFITLKKHNLGVIKQKKSFRSNPIFQNTILKIFKIKTTQIPQQGYQQKT
jgi:hypothetical protein